MIDKEFIELTDRLIKKIEESGIQTGNGNVLLCKPGVSEKTKGGIVLADTMYSSDSKYNQKRRNFARIIAIPGNLAPDQGDMDLQVGDYVFYTYTAETPLNPMALDFIYDEPLNYEDDGKHPFLTTTQDAEIIQTIPQKVVHAKA